MDSGDQRLGPGAANIDIHINVTSSFICHMNVDIVWSKDYYFLQYGDINRYTVHTGETI